MLMIFPGSLSLFAQTTGKIIGNVSDFNTGEPLVGANIYLDEAPLGAATDSEGDFYIINVPPGSYTVNVQVIGYELYTVKDVQVSVNRSSNLEIKMKESIMEGETIVVSAEKVSQKKDQTSSIKNVSDKQIEVLPVESINEVVEMQAGVIDGHFRGGRSNEVSYLIDGLQVDEVFSGESSTINLEKEVVSDLEVITGTFNAEYGKAMSGIVNIVTKDGSNEFHGSAYANFANYVTTNDNIFIGLDNLDFSRKQDYKMQLEGPVIKDKVFFIANARYVNDQGYLNGIRRFEVDNYSDFNTPQDQIPGYENSKWATDVDGDLLYSEHTGDGSYVPMNFEESLTLFGKLTFKFFDRLKMALLFSHDQSENAGYNHSLKYNPDGMATNHNQSDLLSLQFNHLISNQIFYDLKFSYNYNWYGRYLYKDPLDSRYVSSSYSSGVGGFSSGGDDKTHSEQFTDQYLGKFDLTWQINKHHSIKTGVQYTQYRVENRPEPVRHVDEGAPELSEKTYDPETDRVIVYPWIPELIPYGHISVDQYVRKPYDFSLYVQDKMEYDDLVINYGLRYDYFNANTVYPTNRANPANQDLNAQQSEYPKADPEVQISPRIGLSYTLGKSAVLHFSYGHFFQIPPFYALYQNHHFLVPTNSFAIQHGNAQINAQKTIKYEMGLWQELTPELSLEVSVYSSDVKDLLTAVVYTSTNQIEYAVFGNKDNANTKGLEVVLKWGAGGIYSDLNYTLQFTRGNADNPLSTFNRLGQNQDPIPVLIPLAWDQRHTVTMNVGYAQQDYALSLTGYYNSGFPYTIDAIPQSRLARQNILPNTGVKPSNYRLDLQGHYDVPLSEATKLRFFLYVKNLTDVLNELQVYGRTGRAYTNIVFESDEEVFRSNFNNINDQYENPAMYSAPREIKLGVGYLF
ncbi:MAG: TonB-dependent receptor [Calditrichae bacterium]|nr:TonB-dependent receptor [Calditrichia bacterium]